MNANHDRRLLSSRTDLRTRRTRPIVALATIAAAACTALALAQSGEAPPPAAETSFASAFFYASSVQPDGTHRMEWLGTILIWILLALSLVNIGLIGQLFMTNRRQLILPPDLGKRLRSRLEQGKHRDAMELAGSDGSDLGRIVRVSLGQAPFGFNAMLRALEQSSEEVITDRLRRAESLNILGQVSPMIGLFGTVYGMIVAFQSIAQSGGNADPVLLAGGIGTALVTTFWGLLVAIPALAAYATIRNRIDSLATEASLEAQSLIERFRPKPRENGDGKAAAEQRAGGERRETGA
ncbi:MAG: MotA/TolQ/ExbB proton channel family protein [Phycisphaerales bacterium]